MNFAEEYLLHTCDVTAYRVSGSENPLLWRPDMGVGYLRSTGFAYDEEYWERYQDYERSELGTKLTDVREAFVRRHLPDPSKLCDVGVGSGQFIKRVGARGYDVNPYARNWLEKQKLYSDPYVESFEALTFWDVLEHIDNPAEILSRTKKVFMSVPIHADAHACLTSKHLRPNEHIWHFTHHGLVLFMGYHGFILWDSDDGETAAGREAIMTYYFEHV